VGADLPGAVAGSERGAELGSAIGARRRRGATTIAGEGGHLRFFPLLARRLRLSYIYDISHAIAPGRIGEAAEAE
jgi:hypothetical protein